jgi:hypothetical protein
MRFVVPLMLILASCSKPGPSTWSMLDAPLSSHWKLTGNPDNGTFELSANELVLSQGKPMTCTRFDAWESMGLPTCDYAITFEAQRVEGHDFFAAITFPVRRIDTCATLVVGGWGGGLVGISSIDGEDASVNATRSEQQFVNGQWYRFRLEIRSDELKAWMNDNPVINASIKARTISLRIGDIEGCAPFGVATYFTKGRVRNLVVSKL